MKVLITGATGSGAYWLIKHILKECPGVGIFGTTRNLSHVKENFDGRVTFYEVDMMDAGSVHQCIASVRPNRIFHYACNPSKGFSTPVLAIQTPAIGTVNLFHAVMDADIWPRIINVSSAEVYGDVKPTNGDGIKEEDSKHPLSPYAIGKLAQDNLGYLYHKAYSLDVVTLRAFSYINPIHRSLFSSVMAKQIAEIERGKRQCLNHGDLTSIRCFMDCKNVARAFWLASEKCDGGEAYNIGGNDVFSIGELLDKLTSYASKPIPRVLDFKLFRPADVRWQVPDTYKFRTKTGWAPPVGLDDSLQDLLTFYRGEAAKT